MNQSGCTIYVAGPAGEVSLPSRPGANLRDTLIAGGVALRSDCGGIGVCGKCQVRVAESGDMPFAHGERLRLSATQLGSGVRLACQVIPAADLHVSMERAALQMGWRPLRDDEYGTHGSFASGRKTAGYGVAIDLGTTHLRLSLWNLAGGERIAGRAGLNPQGSYGADVLTRLMEASRSAAVARELGSLVQQDIAEALTDIAELAGLSLDGIGEVRVVGNTAMLGLLAGQNFLQLLQPEYWTRRMDCQPEDTSFLRKAWGLGSEAGIRFVTPLGGFIGSDLLAGVIATRLIEQEAGSLLIDFGTNSEMALWDGHVLHVTSTAGGPAFEGCGISCGMPGETGAIYRVAQGNGGEFGIRVLGDVEPLGVCGSGLVDAVAWLRRTGRLDKVGRFTAAGGKGALLHEGAQRIEVKPADIDVLQRAKAAIGGGVRWLCLQAGLRLGELRQVYACGAFGRLLDVGNAQLIGLLPPVPQAAVQLEGNTALAGCEALLLSTEAEQALDTVLAVSRVYNLAEDAAFESLFVESLYLQPMQDFGESLPMPQSGAGSREEAHHAG